jgi:hypothetical protein
MSLIMRWFEANGERHRAFFREQEPTGRRELVIGGPDWQYATPDPDVARLEDLSEDTLIGLAGDLRARASTAESQPRNDAFGD